MHRRIGFTLIELLVVISVIVLLIAILMPSLNSASGKAKAVICESNLHQWGLLFIGLANENNGQHHQDERMQQVRQEMRAALDVHCECGHRLPLPKAPLA